MVKSLRIIRLIARDTCRQIVFHNPWFQLAVAGMVLAGILLAPLGELPLGSSAPKLYYDWGNGLILGLSGLVMAVLLSYLIQQDLSSDFLMYLLTRSVGRCEYLLGKTCGVVLPIAVVMAVADLLLALIVYWKLEAVSVAFGTPAHSIGWMVYCQLLVFQVLYLSLVAGLVLLVNSFSKSFLFSVLATLLLWFACLFTGSVPLVSDGWGGVLRGILGVVLPRFEIVFVSDALWYLGALGGVDLLSRIGIGFVYLLCLTGLSAYVFNRREL